MHELYKLEHLDMIQNKDIIDVGGHIGDSAILFSKYTSGTIYTFEPTTSNYELMIETIKLNESKNIVPVKLALGAETTKMKIKLFGAASTLNISMPAYEASDKYEEISVTTLDAFLNGKELNIGLIKVDIEGYEQEFLKGAFNTIKKYRPTMLISIYHNASDFFDIKPMIEAWDLGYLFKVSRPIDGGILGETVLICER